MSDELGKVRGQLEDAEEAIDDLKQQLDVALGAEDMLEQLTERTLTMGEVGLVFVLLHFHPDG
jgi:dynactin 1